MLMLLRRNVLYSSADIEKYVRPRTTAIVLRESFAIKHHNGTRIAVHTVDGK